MIHDDSGKSGVQGFLQYILRAIRKCAPNTWYGFAAPRAFDTEAIRGKFTILPS